MPVILPNQRRIAMLQKSLEEDPVVHLKPEDLGKGIGPAKGLELTEDSLRKQVTLALEAAGPRLAPLEQQLMTDKEKLNRINADLVLLRGSRGEDAIKELRTLQKAPNLAHSLNGFGPTDDHFQIENGFITIGRTKYVAPTDKIACTQATFRAVVAAYWDRLGADFSTNVKLHDAFDKWLINTRDKSGAIGAVADLQLGYALKDFQDIRRGDLVQFYWPDPAQPEAGHSGQVTRVDRDASGNIANIQILSATNEKGILPAIKLTDVRNLSKYRENGLGHDDKFPGYRMFAARLYEAPPTDQTYNYDRSLQFQADQVDRRIQPVQQTIDLVQTLDRIVKDPRLSRISDGLPRRLMDELTGKEVPLTDLNSDLRELKALADNKTWSVFETKLKQGHLNAGRLENTSDIEGDVLRKLGGTEKSLEELRGLVDDSAARLTLLTADKSLWNLRDRNMVNEEYEGLRGTLRLAELMVKAETRQSIQGALETLHQAVAADPSLSINKRLQDVLDRIRAKVVPEEVELRLWIQQVLDNPYGNSQKPAIL
jgi:hypothetical protein